MGQLKLRKKLTVKQRIKRYQRMTARATARELRERAARKYLKFLYEGSM